MILCEKIIKAGPEKSGYDLLRKEILDEFNKKHPNVPIKSIIEEKSEYPAHPVETNPQFRPEMNIRLSVVFYYEEMEKVNNTIDYEMKSLVLTHIIFQMIQQFMYTHNHDGQEYFFHQFESAGEAAFDAIGFSGDEISKRNFYKKWDDLSETIAKKKGENNPISSRYKMYIEDLSKERPIQDSLDVAFTVSPSDLKDLRHYFPIHSSDDFISHMWKVLDDFMDEKDKEVKSRRENGKHLKPKKPVTNLLLSFECREDVEKFHTLFTSAYPTYKWEFQSLVDSVWQVGLTVPTKEVRAICELANTVDGATR